MTLLAELSKGTSTVRSRPWLIVKPSSERASPEDAGPVRTQVGQLPGTTPEAVATSSSSETILTRGRDSRAPAAISASLMRSQPG